MITTSRHPRPRDGSRSHFPPRARRPLSPYPRRGQGESGGAEVAAPSSSSSSARSFPPSPLLLVLLLLLLLLAAAIAADPDFTTAAFDNQPIGIAADDAVATAVDGALPASAFGGEPRASTADDDGHDENNMLDGTIVCGYQGWFGFPGDGAPMDDWRHWLHRDRDGPGRPAVEMYPAIDEYDDDDLAPAPHMRMGDGSGARFFSSARPNVVLKHFEWMRTYGIRGAFNHRFMANRDDAALHDTRTMVLRNVRRAAEATGRMFAVSYDVTGNGNDVIDDLRDDWIALVDGEGVTGSGSYIRQSGLPVLHIWGIGFAHVNVTDLVGLGELVDWLRSEAAGKYRVFLIGGVPSRWRDRTGDSRTDPGWEEIYDSFDGIQPWHVARWRTVEEFESYHDEVISKDAEHCAAREVLYLPTMWAGFSWHNLQKGKRPINAVPPINAIPRLGGDLLWSQAYRHVADPNVNSIWLAQFDEVDEGTAIFKVAASKSDLPVDGNWLALDADGMSVPSDWYLRLAGEAQSMLEGKTPLSRKIPIDPDHRLTRPVENVYREE